MFKRSSALRSQMNLAEGQAHVDFEKLSRQTGVSVEELQLLLGSTDKNANPRPAVKTTTSSLDQFATDYARLQSPAYQRLARKAEESVVERLGFRRFGEKR